MRGFIGDMGDNPFLLTGLLAGLLASLACGVMGPYVITRRIVFLSGAIAHMALAGLGAAIFLHAHFPEALRWLKPLHGATVSALAGACLIGWLQHQAKERLDTLIGALWAIGMATGIVLIKVTPGYQTDLLSYLFGNITYVTWSDLGWISLLDGVILLTVLLFHKRLVAICLDQQHAALQGIPVVLTNMILLSLVALTVVTLIQIVGIILVLALLTLPAATAAHYAARLPAMIGGAVALACLVTTLPRMALYGTPVSPEAGIVLSAGLVYLLSVPFSRCFAGGGP